MTEGLCVSPAEDGRIRVFTLDLPEDEISLLKSPRGDAPSTGAAVAHFLGLDWLDAEFLEIFPISDLTGLGLAGYLTEGNGVPEKDVSNDRDKLDAVSGHVLVIYSRAFQGKPARIAPDRRVALVGVYSEEKPDVAFTALPSESAKGVLSPAASAEKPANPHLTVLLALLALPVLALFAGVLIYWVSR